MKVLQVIDQLKVGGAERVAVDLTVLLSKNELVEVSFLCLLNEADLDQELKNENISVIYLRRNNKFNPVTLLKLNYILNSFDIVHVHSRHVLRYISVLNYLPLNKKYKLVFHDHYGEIEHNKSISNFLKKGIQTCEAYIGVSQSLTSWAKENNLNQNGYLLSNIIQKQTQFKKISKPGDIIVVGNFRPQKNYEFLIKLAKILPSSIQIDVYGAIIDTDYYKKIKQLVNQYQLEKQIHFIINKKNITPYLKNYKLALHCAASETGPLVAIEYLSQEIPLIMYHTGEVADVIQNYLTEYILNNFDINSWKEKIELLLNDQELRQNIKLKCKKIYTSYFSEEKYIKKCMAIYHQVLK